MAAVQQWARCNRLSIRRIQRFKKRAKRATLYSFNAVLFTYDTIKARESMNSYAIPMLNVRRHRNVIFIAATDGLDSVRMKFSCLSGCGEFYVNQHFSAFLFNRLCV